MLTMAESTDADIVPLLARQPIYDGELNIIGYELLFRGGNHQLAVFDDENAATSQVILNAFTALPVIDLLGGKPAYINYPRQLLDSPPPMAKDALVVEILENIEIDSALLAAIKALKDKGYTIALDDYIFRDVLEHHHLLGLADIVKLDVIDQDMAAVSRAVQRLKPYNVILLAEKVETHEVFEACKQMGFSQFQGYFLAKPQLVEGRKLSGNRQAAMRLLSTLENPDVEFEDVEKAITADASLSYKLMRLVNSAFFGVRKEIDSLHRAIAMIGLNRIRSLASMLVLGGFSDKPTALHESTLVRARMCELLAEQVDESGSFAQSTFTVGMFSHLDAYLDMSMEEVLSGIGLADSVQQAILSFDGKSGGLLKIVEAFECGEFEQLHRAELQNLGLDLEVLEQAYIESVRWASEHISLMKV